MVTFTRIRSLWGTLPGPSLETWKKKLPEWKAHGYAGIEVDYRPYSDEQLKGLKTLADELDLVISVTLHTAWDYNGPRPPGLTPDVHLQSFREQLRRASILNPIRVNAHSGSDFWHWDDMVYFYQNALVVEKEEGYEGRVTHETHRNRAFHSPYTTDYVLQRVPGLRVTADISHWVVVGERLLTGEEDDAILTRLIPHVFHIHTRTGTTQSSQCPEPLNPAFAAERDFFEKLWLRIIRYKQEHAPDTEITWVPEYGPFPYHPIGTYQTFDELADSEGKRLEALFAQAVASS